MDNTHKENLTMQIAVPDNIAAAALGGDTSVLTEVQEAYAALKDAQSRAQAALLPDIAQVLADGLARPKATNGENATMTITEDGQMVVDLAGHEDEETPEAPTVPTPAPAPAKASGNDGKVKYPSIGELRQRAAACGADISDIAPQNKKDILAAIEAAEAAPAPEPEVEEEPLTEPEEEIAAEAEPETTTDEPETTDEDDGLGLDDGPDEEPVESPENEENVPAIEPPSDDELDVDNWLDD